MKSTKSTFVVLSLVLLTTGALRAMENKEDISGTMKASCLVQVTSDPAIFPVNWQTIEALVYSSDVAGKAAREILEISPDEVSDIVLIEILESRPGVSPPPATGLGLPGGSPRPATSSRSRTTKPTLSEDGGMDEYMMEGYGMEMGAAFPGPSSPTARPRSSSSGTSSSRSRSSSYRRSTTTVRRVGETTAQYEARRRADAAARSRTSTSRPQPAPATGAISAVGQTSLLELTVDLPDEAVPAAKEFLDALIDNLRNVLVESHDGYARELQSQLEFAERQRDAAEAQLAESTAQVEAVKVTPAIKLDPADAAVREQLETVVDLSNFSQAMSFEEVVMELEQAVDPPLQIQPNWKDLLEFADIEPTTPALMDALTGVKLSKAMDVLVSGVSSDLTAVVDYVIDEGVIVIATEDSLPKKMLTHVYEIPALAYSAAGARGLVNAIQESVEPVSWFELNDLADGTVNTFMGNKLAVYQTYDVHLEIAKFLQSLTTDIPVSTPSQIPPQMLLSEKRNLLREKQIIEMETVRLQARQLGIESQIKRIKDEAEAKAKPDPVIAELEQLVEMHAAQLARLQKQFETGTVSLSGLAPMKEKLTRARIDLAKRRQETSLPAGGDQVGKYNVELADITIELAEKAAALQLLNEQLGQTEHQLIAATTIDPRASRIRTAARAFEMADERVNGLNARIVNLAPPMVSVIGGR